MITLRQLRYLAALAEHRHFGKAAEACAVTQPALSMQIRELEKELGVELVERRPGEVDAHRDRRSRSRGAPSACWPRRAISSISPAISGRLLTGRLRLGVIPTLAPYVLPKILPVLQRRYPDLRVELRETQTQVLLDELARGALDVVMLALPVDGRRDRDACALFDDPFLLAVPATDPRPESARVDVARHRSRSG